MRCLFAGSKQRLRDRACPRWAKSTRFGKWIPGQEAKRSISWQETLEIQTEQSTIRGQRLDASWGLKTAVWLQSNSKEPYLSNKLFLPPSKGLVQNDVHDVRAREMFKRLTQMYGLWFSDFQRNVLNEKDKCQTIICRLITAERWEILVTEMLLQPCDNGWGNRWMLCRYGLVHYVHDVAIWMIHQSRYNTFVQDDKIAVTSH